MSESYIARAYWGSRLESATECAQRAAVFFRMLTECHPSYTRWYEKVDSMKRARPLQFEPTRETFVRFFGMKKYRLWKAEDRDFTFGAWTGHERQDQGGAITLHCGGDCEAGVNRVFLEFPNEALGSERMITEPVMAGVMRAMALAWDPDWAIATANGLWDQFFYPAGLGSFVGWMTYVSRRRGEIPPLPEPVRVERVEDKGSLIILTPERLTPSNPEHVNLARRIQGLLEERGLLNQILRQRPPPRA